MNFISAALLVYGAMHLYAFGKVWRIFPRSLWLAMALILGGVALTLSPMAIRRLESHGWHDTAAVAAWGCYIWMGFIGLLFCISVAFDSGHALVSLLKLRIRQQIKEAAKFRAACLLAFLAVIYGLLEARQIQIEEVRIPTPKLASGRITIAQVSDLHIGLMMGRAFIERINARLNEIKPDIVVATGDIVDGQGDDLDTLAQYFHGFTPPLGAYAVTGNHERFAGLENSLRFLRNAGFTVLRNESVATGGIVLSGEDDSTLYAQDRTLKTGTAKNAISFAANDFVVLLKHQPVVDNSIRFDLQLSGHIHGGQIYPFVHLTRMVYDIKTGLTRLADGRLLYVSRGTGTWGPPIRLFAPPEITLITIESERRL